MRDKTQRSQVGSGPVEIITDDVTGTVFVTDDRPDGTTVVLICGPPGGPQTSGPVIEDQGSFPVGYRVAKAASAPNVILDTTLMPTGRAQFHLSAFLPQRATAFRSGESEVRLSPESALVWGYEPEPKHG